MKASIRWLKITLPMVLAASLIPLGTSTASALQTPNRPSPAAPAPVSNSGPTQQPGISAAQQQSPEAPAPPAPQPIQAQSNNAGKTPVGTAAAPYEPTVGVAASRPAGAAIAPAKQKRISRIFIRVGLLVGAAVAIGTVVALSRTSSGRPN